MPNFKGEGGAESPSEEGSGEGVFFGEGPGIGPAAAILGSTATYISHNESF